MPKNYFPNRLYNELPCGLAEFKNNDDFEIVYANEIYYSCFSNGISDKLNISADDKQNALGIIKKIAPGNKEEICYKCDT